MVGALTVGKKKYADVEEDIKALMVKGDELREKLLECINKDAVAFEPLSKAYGIPKDDPTRDEVMEKCLHDAAQVPFEILCLCCEVIELQVDFVAKGSALAVSDAGTGVVIAKAALQGAAHEGPGVRRQHRQAGGRAHGQVHEAGRRGLR